MESGSSRHHKEIFENVIVENETSTSSRPSPQSMQHEHEWDEHEHTIPSRLSFAQQHNRDDTSTPQSTTPHPFPCDTEPALSTSVGVHESHISALCKLHVSNLNNSMLTPSPNDAIQHQDIKYRKLRSSKANNEGAANNSSFSLRNALWSSMRTVQQYTHNAGLAQQQHHHEEYDTLDDDDGDDEEVKHEDDGEGDDDEDDEKKQSESVAQPSPLQSIVNSPQFMSNAIAMYGELDHALQNINALKEQRLQQQQQQQPHGGGQPMSSNEQVIEAMKTLISSTTEMSSFFNTDTSTSTNANTSMMHGGRRRSHEAVTTTSSSTSVVGGLLRRLSSSIAYMSYLSISSITPFVYNMVEAVLVELYATIKDIIEFYDPDPKNNILWRLIHKMSEIIEAIRGLIALSDCFYETAQLEDDVDDSNTQSSFSLFPPSKEKKD